MDGKQQYWKKVENPKQHVDSSAAQGSSKAPEKRQNGVYGSASVVPEADEEQHETWFSQDQFQDSRGW
jgi:hypothetical protein